MTIVSANIPVEYLEMGDNLVGKDGLYSSRSELLRYAIREFLLKKLKVLEKIELNQESPLSEDNPPQKEDSTQNHYIRIPIGKNDNKYPSEKEFKKYKILKKLEL